MIVVALTVQKGVLGCGTVLVLARKYEGTFCTWEGELVRMEGILTWELGTVVRAMLMEYSGANARIAKLERKHEKALMAQREEIIR